MPLIDNAIIMAAGKGTRMRPLTYQTPKPLIEVNGKPMIESVIDGLHQNGIKDITVVIGYLGEHFSYLTDKYAGLKLINNPYYDQYNNISSLYVARNELKNTVILDGDQVITNPQILDRHFEHSGYAGVKINQWSDEWIMHVDDENKIISCSRDGDDQGWRLYSLSKWRAVDSERLKRLLTHEFEDLHHYDLYWDDVAMFKYFDQFELAMMPIKRNDIIEIDSLDQLKEVERRLKG
ncbi:NTP transferase domain-containing protein [Limosilactobacillus sp.]|jgi:CTP:phosphocholine cytidylyltransferase-like protein|uniref:NTP transferase domain-containing protein n=1 Tax=Limosilactobacillus sp. TaxID=2773925 RepID=UPI0025C0C851|nr:NTP transferase domain-containing protein [Limosilactobacillus sp.]MCH3923198.1 NTP transferase domain-containing protein [Limosilactobacillus sp.]MCH3927881.1 NTP transferase domain-containing protein [Limosilactobacillus sp.]